MAAHLAEGSPGGAVMGTVLIPSPLTMGAVPVPPQALSWPLLLLLSEVSHGPRCFLEICSLCFGDKQVFLFLISFSL